MKPSVQHGILASDLVTLLLSFDGSILVSASNGALFAFDALSGKILCLFILLIIFVILFFLFFLLN